MSDPNKPGSMSATLKHDGREGTWLVFHGSPAEVRSMVIETMEIEDNGAPLFDLINEATRVYKASGNINATLGGRVVGGKNQKQEGSTDSGSAWDRTGSTAEDKPDPNVVRLTAAIEGASDVTALKTLFARNKAAFDENADLLAEWKKKGKSFAAA